MLHNHWEGRLPSGHVMCLISRGTEAERNNSIPRGAPDRRRSPAAVTTAAGSEQPPTSAEHSEPWRRTMSIGSLVRASMRMPGMARPWGLAAAARSAAAPPRALATSIRHNSSWLHPGVLHPHQKNIAPKIRGRGRGNGLGKTSGRGQMGQKAQAGPRNPRLGFEGGQTPLTKLFPKKGKRNVLKRNYVPVTLGRIQTWINRGLIDPSKKITVPVLVQTNCISRVKDGVKLLCNKSELFDTPIDIEVTQATPEAIRLIEVNDGTITTRYHGKVYLRSLIRPFKWLLRGRPLPTPPVPFRKKDLSAYFFPFFLCFPSCHPLLACRMGSFHAEFWLGDGGGGGGGGLFLYAFRFLVVFRLPPCHFYSANAPAPHTD